MTGRSRSNAVTFCEGEKCRAMPTASKPRARRSSVTKRPIRPEAPSTRILRAGMGSLISPLKRFCDHQPQNDHDRAEPGNPEQAPAAEQRKIARWQRLVLRRRHFREIAHLDLHEDHGHPEQPGDDIKP